MAAEAGLMGALAKTLPEMREDAARQQLALTERLFVSVADLAHRWRLSENTIRSIPRALLPYMEFGNGVRFRRRRFRLEDVLAYEDAERRGAR